MKTWERNWSRVCEERERERERERDGREKMQFWWALSTLIIWIVTIRSETCFLKNAFQSIILSTSRNWWQRNGCRIVIATRIARSKSGSRTASRERRIARNGIRIRMWQTRIAGRIWKIGASVSVWKVCSGTITVRHCSAITVIVMMIVMGKDGRTVLTVWVWLGHWVCYVR